MAFLKSHRTTQIERRLRLGPDYDDHDLVVAHPDGSPVNPEYVSKLFRRLAGDLAMAGVHFHCLRHTAATKLLSLGVHPKIVQECLGHSSIAITMDTYSHVAPTMQEEAAKQLDSALRSVVAGSGNAS